MYETGRGVGAGWSVKCLMRRGHIRSGHTVRLLTGAIGAEQCLEDPRAVAGVGGRDQYLHQVIAPSSAQLISQPNGLVHHMMRSV
jgi:hypothetical protein